jgi:hypothetical protein
MLSVRCSCTHTGWDPRPQRWRMLFYCYVRCICGWYRWRRLVVSIIWCIDRSIALTCHILSTYTGTGKLTTWTMWDCSWSTANSGGRIESSNRGKLVRWHTLDLNPPCWRQDQFSVRNFHKLLTRPSNIHTMHHCWWDSFVLLGGHIHVLKPMPAILCYQKPCSSGSWIQHSIRSRRRVWSYFFCEGCTL